MIHLALLFLPLVFAALATWLFLEVAETLLGAILGMFRD